MPPQGAGITDTVEMKRCRVAWIELVMFAKCVLRVERRGVRPAQAFSRARNRLDRWCNGDRHGLWREVVDEDEFKNGRGKAKGGFTEKTREARVNKLAGLGRIGAAMQALISPGVAADTPAVEGKLDGKFHSVG